MYTDFLELEDTSNNIVIFDDVEILIDPELEDESTIDINKYMDKYVLQCRICGNQFPSAEILADDEACIICDERSANGFIYKGKIAHKDKTITDDDINNDIEQDESINADINWENNETIETEIEEIDDNSADEIMTFDNFDEE